MMGRIRLTQIFRACCSAEKAEDFATIHWIFLGINNFILKFQAPLFSTINADRGAFVPLQKGGFI